MADPKFKDINDYKQDKPDIYRAYLILLSFISMSRLGVIRIKLVKTSPVLTLSTLDIGSLTGLYYRS